eukprot:7209321-Alexandrium_andersonii.AAC.1
MTDRNHDDATTHSRSRFLEHLESTGLCTPTRAPAWRKCHARHPHASARLERVPCSALPRERPPGESRASHFHAGHLGSPGSVRGCSEAN